VEIDMASFAVGGLKHPARALLGASLVALSGCGGDGGPTQSLIPDGPGLSCYANPTQGAPTDAASVVTLDAAQRFQTMQGFGTTERLFDDPHVTNTFDAATNRGAAVIPAAEQSKILDALYTDLGLTRMRIHPSDGGLIEPVNDNGDPNVADLTKFNFAWKNSDGYITLVKSAAARGLTTFYGSPLGFEKWMTESNPAEYAEWAFVLLRYWRDRGVEMPYYSLKNEPGYNPSGGVWSGAYLRDVTKILGARIKADGMKTKIVIPDDLNANEAYPRLQTILGDADARQYVGAISYHMYGAGGEDRIAQLGAQYNLPIWMSEYSTPDSWFDWAKLMQQLIADDGVSAVDYMWGYFGDWDRSQLVRILVKNSAYAGIDFTRQYYVTGQYSKYVRPGAVRIASSSADPDVKVAAFLDGAKVIVVATNVGSRDHLMRVELGSSAPCARKVDAVRTSETESWLALPQASLEAPRFSANLPHGSVTTFVGHQ
jgi:glucuronoarabinoxylan endo-1,4-beta-xylanase